MSPARTVFAPTTPPAPLTQEVRERLCAEHAARPFGSAEVRATIHRARATLEGLPVAVTVYRGGLGLTGVEVDHLWLGLRPDPHAPAALADPADEAHEHEPEAAAGSRHAWVLDVAFPLFADDFVAVLRRYVAGDAERVDLESVGAAHGLEARVVGAFPRSVRYRGQPVLSALER